MHPFDRVTVDGKTVGVSTWIGYSANEGKMLTLAVLDAEHAEPGTEVDVRLGRGGRRHQQADRRARTSRWRCGAIVSPVPYVETVRSTYRPDSWRTARV